MNLYPFQQTGVEFLLNAYRPDALRQRAAFLADRMGLGKTVQAAAAARALDPGTVLVVCKASAVENWRREWATWGPARADFRVRSWATVHQETEAPDLLILDEVHLAKNPDARRSKAALGLARRAGRVFALSGTPMPNHPGELWAIVSTLWPEIPAELGIGSQMAWFRRFCRFSQSPYGLKVWGVKNADQLAAYIPRIMLRRAVADVGVELPPARVDVELLTHAPSLDAALLAEGINPETLKSAMAEQAESETGLSALRRLLGLYKAPLVASQINDELNAGEYRKVVVLAYHRDVLDVLRSALAHHGAVGFDGSTPQAQRQAAIDAFTSDPRARVFIGQSTAAGDSINLQAASEIVLVEPSWSPADNAQAVKRVHRIGSTDRVRARLYAVAGTIDEAILETVARKTRMQMEVL